MKRFLVFMALAFVVLAPGCLSNNEKKGGKCPLPTTNPLDCMEGITLVQTSDGCNIIKCRESLNNSDRILGGISDDYYGNLNNATVDDSEKTAIEYLLGSSDYAKGGYDLIMAEMITEPCRYCWNFTYIFKAESNESAGTLVEYTKVVSVRRGVVNSTKTESSVMECNKTEDCPSSDSPTGVQILCEEGVCKRRVLGNNAAISCTSIGGRSEIRRIDGEDVGYCVFSDGSECEEWAHYRGECTRGQKVRGCEGYYDTLACNEGDNPVCGKVEMTSGEIRWITFNNACTACISSTGDQTVLGYKMGNCSQYETETEGGGG